MKRCLRCDGRDVSAAWQCQGCGWQTEVVDGFRVFAPTLAAGNDGFAADAHENLQRLQDGSFWFRARNRLISDLTRKHFSAARQVLEVGCGTGFVLTALQAALPEGVVSGSEIYLNGLPYAQHRIAGRGELFQMDARFIPFAGAFDLICAFDVLEHIDEDEAVLRRMFEALAPGGGVLLSVPQHPWLWSRNDDIACHKRRYRPGELEAKCRAAGFEILLSTSFVTSLLPAMALQRTTKAQKTDYNPEVEMRLPIFVDKSFEALLDMERLSIRAGLRLPVGGSRFVAARRL